MKNKRNTNQGAQTVVRAVDILKLVASNEFGARLTDIAHEMELETPTAHRLLKTLASQGLLVRDEKTLKYRLGSLIFELGLAAKSDFDISAMCLPILKKLANDTLDTSFLFIRSANDAVCVAREMGGYYIQTPVIPIGNRQPLGVSAGGLALLSALPEDEADMILADSAMKLNIYGGLTISQTKDLYLQAREQEYATIENHAVSGVKGVGIPIIIGGRAAAAITVATTIERMDETHIDIILPRLRKAAEDIKLLMSANSSS